MVHASSRAWGARRSCCVVVTGSLYYCAVRPMLWLFGSARSGRGRPTAPNGESKQFGRPPRKTSFHTSAALARSLHEGAGNQVKHHGRKSINRQGSEIRLGSRAGNWVSGEG